jgi:YVTN family beta-propeller protein
METKSGYGMAQRVSFPCTWSRFRRAAFGLLSAFCANAIAAGNYEVFVSNEKSGDVTVIDGGTLEAVATFPVGKRPRGIHSSPDGRTVYVALSGKPIEGPPTLDASGNPVFSRDDDDEDDEKSDKSADGIGVVDARARKVTGKIASGSDPEEFDLSKDGRKLYVSNEDVKTASVIDIGSRKVEHIVSVAGEPEGVATTPDGSSFYVTCETGGDVYVVNASTYQTVGHFKVGARPRSVAFLDSGRTAVIPSESAGQLSVIDTATAKVTRTVALPTGSRPMRVRVSPQGDRLYVSTGRAGVVLVLDARTFAVLSTIKVGTRPWGIALSPDGKYLFAANGTSNDVSVVDLAAGKEIKRIKAGDGPWGVTIVQRAQ